MQYPAPHSTLRLLLAASGLALVLGGCAVPVAQGYGYETYEGYGPAYPPPVTYGVPAGPPMIYGVPPPVMFGGQIWIDSIHRPPPPRWRDEPRWRGEPRGREGGRDGPWRHDRDHDQNRWRQERPPDARQRVNPPGQQAPRWNPPGREDHQNRDRGGRSDRDGRQFP